MSSDSLALTWPPDRVASPPPNVFALSTTRRGGHSEAPYDSLNLGDHVGDPPSDVLANRAHLATLVPPSHRPPTFCWLNQVHGTTVIDAGHCASSDPTPTADAAFCTRPLIACTVLTADCLPVLFWDRHGRVVAAAHAGWRGLADGVLEATVDAMPAASTDLFAWLGPAIGPHHFQVGADVRQPFVHTDPDWADHFHPTSSPDDEPRWLADLPALATDRLHQLGLADIIDGSRCTYSHPQHFFSYRRDHTTGRMASAIWLHP